MDKPPLHPPHQRGFDLAYEEAYRLAAQRLAKITDLMALCQRTGASLVGENTLALEYLGQAVRVHLAAEITTSGDLSPRDKLIILHYLNTAKGSPATGRLITFKELPEGGVYYLTFIKRTIKPLLDAFGQNLGRLLEIAAKIGGERVDMGDVSIKIKALPHVPVTLILWQGDEELSSEGNILLDSSITDYLPTEDITVLCEIIAWKLAKIA